MEHAAYELKCWRAPTWLLSSAAMLRRVCMRYVACLRWDGRLHFRSSSLVQRLCAVAPLGCRAEQPSCEFSIVVYRTSECARRNTHWSQPLSKVTHGTTVSSSHRARILRGCETKAREGSFDAKIGWRRMVASGVQRSLGRRTDPRTHAPPRGIQSSRSRQRGTPPCPNFPS